MKRLLLALIIIIATCQVAHAQTRTFIATSTVAQLPPAASNLGIVFYVIDGTTFNDCTSGGAPLISSYKVACSSNGTSWISSGGAGTAQPFLGPSPWYDVTNAAYGATGNGTTDDTVAIQAAIDAQVASASGAPIYFPCGRTFKFGTLDLSGLSTPRTWKTLYVCGVLKPTATIMLDSYQIAIVGAANAAGNTQGQASFSEHPYTAIDASLLTPGDPLIHIGNNIFPVDPIFINAIGAQNLSGDGIEIGGGANEHPTNITINNTVFSMADTTTKYCIESSAGFGLYMDGNLCTGGLNNDNTGIFIHGTGILRITNQVLGRRGIYFDTDYCPTGIVGTWTLSNFYAENFLDTAYFTIHTTAGCGTEAVNIGPSMEMSDPVAGGDGIYLIQHTGDTSTVKMNINLGAMRGWTTTMVNGGHFQITANGETSSNFLSGIDSTSSLIGVINSSWYGIHSTLNSIGCTGGTTNITLTICQAQAASPALILKPMTGTEDTMFQIKRIDGTTPAITLYQEEGIGGGWGFDLWNTAGTFRTRIPKTNVTANRTWTLADGDLTFRSGTMCVDGTCNASTLGGTTFASPAAIGSGTPAPGTFTTGTFNTSITVGSKAYSSLYQAQDCATTSSCSHTDISTSLKIVQGSVPLVTGTPSAATITGISPAFTSTATYNCTATEITDATKNLLKITKVSGSSFTITGPDSITDTVGYVCVGN